MAQQSIRTGPTDMYICKRGWFAARDGSRLDGQRLARAGYRHLYHRRGIASSIRSQHVLISLSGIVLAPTRPEPGLGDSVPCPCKDRIRLGPDANASPLKSPLESDGATPPKGPVSEPADPRAIVGASAKFVVCSGRNSRFTSLRSTRLTSLNSPRCYVGKALIPSLRAIQIALLEPFRPPFLAPAPGSHRSLRLSSLP